MWYSLKAEDGMSEMTIANEAKVDETPKDKVIFGAKEEADEAPDDLNRPCPSREDTEMGVNMVRFRELDSMSKLGSLPVTTDCDFSSKSVLQVAVETENKPNEEEPAEVVITEAPEGGRPVCKCTIG